MLTPAAPSLSPPYSKRPQHQRADAVHLRTPKRGMCEQKGVICFMEPTSGRRSSCLTPRDLSSETSAFRAAGLCRPCPSLLSCSPGCCHPRQLTDLQHRARLCLSTRAPHPAPLGPSDPIRAALPCPRAECVLHGRGLPAHSRVS